jgi:hypothetical protein
VPLTGLRDLAARVATTLEPGPAPPVTNGAGLAPLVGWVVERFLAQAPPVDPSFGALELELVPPFGRAEGE